jgi:hypothetical protein
METSQKTVRAVFVRPSVGQKINRGKRSISRRNSVNLGFVHCNSQQMENMQQLFPPRSCLASYELSNQFRKKGPNSFHVFQRKFKNCHFARRANGNCLVECRVDYLSHTVPDFQHALLLSFCIFQETILVQHAAFSFSTFSISIRKWVSFKID